MNIIYELWKAFFESAEDRIAIVARRLQRKVNAKAIAKALKQ